MRRISLIALLAWSLVAIVTFINMRFAFGESPDERNATIFLKSIRPALNSLNKVARVYYSANCPGNALQPLPFPSTKSNTPRGGKKGLSAVRGIFPKGERVAITEREPNIVVVRIGNVPSEILKTKIHLLKLDPIQQYNAENAIDALENAKEVQAAMHVLGVRAVSILPGLVAPSEERLPHLPPSLTDVTVDQALDLIARTFKGIVLFGTCGEGNGERLFWLEFAGT